MYASIPFESDASADDFAPIATVPLAAFAAAIERNSYVGQALAEIMRLRLWDGDGNIVAVAEAANRAADAYDMIEDDGSDVGLAILRGAAMAAIVRVAVESPDLTSGHLAVIVCSALPGLEVCEGSGENAPALIRIQRSPLRLSWECRSTAGAVILEATDAGIFPRQGWTIGMERTPALPWVPGMGAAADRRLGAAQAVIDAVRDSARPPMPAGQTQPYPDEVEA